MEDEVRQVARQHGWQHGVPPGDAEPRRSRRGRLAILATLGAVLAGVLVVIVLLV